METALAPQTLEKTPKPVTIQEIENEFRSSSTQESKMTDFRISPPHGLRSCIYDVSLMQTKHVLSFVNTNRDEIKHLLDTRSRPE